jgi:hypothetical protein
MSLMSLVVNVLFAGALSFGIGDALFMGFVLPKEESHPVLAQWAGPLIIAFLFVGLFVGNLRVHWSWLGWVFSLATVGGILVVLHFLK